MMSESVAEIYTLGHGPKRGTENVLIEPTANCDAM
jgi:hypothetical protein